MGTFIIYGEERRKELEDFLGFVKNPELMQKRIEELYFDERKKLLDVVVSEIPLLISLQINISKIEQRVLNLKLHKSIDEEGRPDYSWSDLNVYRSYISLSDFARKIMGRIQRLLKEGEKIGLDKHPAIRGDLVGFPVEIPVRDYLNNLGREILVPLNENLERLSTYLKSQQSILF